MIKSLTLENFQAHKNSVLLFDKGVNVIIGQTDNGKSSIIRALRWTITNKPNGDEFRSWAGGDTRVILKTNEGAEISRIKTNSLNSYELGTLEFKAFKTDVPVEIVKALKIEEHNIQQQHDRHFLISETPGAVALHFNKIANLDKIDKGTAAIQSQINTISSDIKYYKKEIETKQTHLESFIDVEQAEKDLKIIEQLDAKKDVLSISIKKLSKRIIDLKVCEVKIEQSENKIKDVPSIDEILDLYKDQKNVRKKVVALKSIIDKINNINSEVKTSEQLVKPEEQINALLELHKKRKNNSATLTKFGQLYTRIETIQRKLTTRALIVEQLEDQFTKNFPDVCPLCNSKIKK